MDGIDSYLERSVHEMIFEVMAAVFLWFSRPIDSCLKHVSFVLRFAKRAAFIGSVD